MKIYPVVPAVPVPYPAVPAVPVPERGDLLQEIGENLRRISDALVRIEIMLATHKLVDTEVEIKFDGQPVVAERPVAK